MLIFVLFLSLLYLLSYKGTKQNVHNKCGRTMLYMLSKRQFTEQLVLIGDDVRASTWFNFSVTEWWCVVYTSKAGVAPVWPVHALY